MMLQTESVLSFLLLFFVQVRMLADPTGAFTKVMLM